MSASATVVLIDVFLMEVNGASWHRRIRCIRLYCQYFKGDQFIDGFLRFDDIKMDMEYHQTFP